MKVLDPAGCDFLQNLQPIASEDVAGLERAQTHYGSSWKKRGGVGAMMMLSRKWDRLEKFVEEHRWDIFHALNADDRAEGVIDDLRDLRRYLLLVEAEARVLEIPCALTDHRDSKTVVAG